MGSDLSTPQSFAIGPYKLDMSIDGFGGPLPSVRDQTGLLLLEEITPAEYKVLPKTFKGEKIFKAPDVSFLGFSWNMMLGVVEGKIYKMSPSLWLPGKSQADEAAMKVLDYCKSKLGEPEQREGFASPETGSFMWHTSDGNVILEKPFETPLGFVINLFFTSRAARLFKKRGWF